VFGKLDNREEIAVILGKQTAVRKQTLAWGFPDFTSSLRRTV